MQISASAIFFALITGILGVWLYLWQAERQHQDYRVHESRVICEKARLDVRYANRFGKASKDVLEREIAACGELATQSGQRAVSEEEAQRKAKELKHSIEKALTSEEAQAELQRIQAEQAAKAAGETAKAVVEQVK